jgi:hypothetical protein
MGYFTKKAVFLTFFTHSVNEVCQNFASMEYNESKSVHMKLISMGIVLCFTLNGPNCLNKVHLLLGGLWVSSVYLEH